MTIYDKFRDTVIHPIMWSSYRLEMTLSKRFRVRRIFTNVDNRNYQSGTLIGYSMGKMVRINGEEVYQPMFITLLDGRAYWKSDFQYEFATYQIGRSIDMLINAAYDLVHTMIDAEGHNSWKVMRRHDMSFHARAAGVESAEQGLDDGISFHDFLLQTTR